MERLYKEAFPNLSVKNHQAAWQFQVCLCLGNLSHCCPCVCHEHVTLLCDNAVLGRKRVGWRDICST